MSFVTGEGIAAFTENFISKKHQVKPYSLELTVAKVFLVRKGGDIDFGGSEQKEAILHELAPVRRSSEAKYGWWNMAAGEYVVKFNEKARIPDNCIGIVQPLLRTLKAGVIHPTLFLTGGEETDMTVLSVGRGGFNIKENARISSLMGMINRRDHG
ncbi:MAG: hypothetical protein U9R44_01325 [Candidatus Omnitrophota bacterium]|nr:hypothetical protein [Candidatus Omnitrophota bacterium]